jgi:hypothetical protein
MSSKRPESQGVRKPLALTDPHEWWVEEARQFGLTVEDLRAQVALADEIIEEIIAEEHSSCRTCGGPLVARHGIWLHDNSVGWYAGRQMDYDAVSIKEAPDDAD